MEDEVPVEANENRGGTRHGGRLVAGDFLHPSEVELDGRASSLERVEISALAPGGEGSKVRFGVYPRLPFEACEVGEGGHLECGVGGVASCDQFASFHPTTDTPTRPRRQCGTRRARTQSGSSGHSPVRGCCHGRWSGWWRSGSEIGRAKD